MRLSTISSNASAGGGGLLTSRLMAARCLHSQSVVGASRRRAAPGNQSHRVLRPQAAPRLWRQSATRSHGKAQSAKAAKYERQFNLFRRSWPPETYPSRPGCKKTLSSAVCIAASSLQPRPSSFQVSSTSAWPNPSLNRSANGMSPGPACGALHSPQSGPGATPPSPG